MVDVHVFGSPEEDIILKLEADTSEEVLSTICAQLLDEGKIKEGYLEALLAREADYPTGLDLGGVNIAIPHTDWQWSNTTQLAIATLAKPVAWRSMEDPDETVEVSMVVMSLFDNPAHQLEALQEIISVVQDQGLVARLVDTDDVREIAQAFNK